MPLRRLPRIFDAARFRLKNRAPGVVLFYKSVNDLPDMHSIYGSNPSESTMIPFEVFSRMWVEAGDLSFAVLAEVNQERKDGYLDLGQTVLHLFHSSGDKFLSGTLGDAMAATDPDPMLRMAAVLIFEVGFDLALRTQAQDDPHVPTGVKPAPSVTAFQRQGETIRYTRLHDLSTASGLQRARPAEPTGIRKREHEVRGHWRTYPSGARVWVRPHRRGDPELGTTVRVITS